MCPPHPTWLRAQVSPEATCPRPHVHVPSAYEPPFSPLERWMRRFNSFQRRARGPSTNAHHDAVLQPRAPLPPRRNRHRLSDPTGIRPRAGQLDALIEPDALTHPPRPVQTVQPFRPTTRRRRLHRLWRSPLPRYCGRVSLSSSRLRLQHPSSWFAGPHLCERPRLHRF